MSDEQARSARRRWLSSGSPEDGARYLLERMRSGGLTEERLRIAALGGSASAQQALGPVAPRIPDDLKGVLVAIAFVSSGAAIMFAIWVVEEILGRVRSEVSNIHVPEEALRAAEACCRCPCDSHRADANEAAFRAMHSADSDPRTEFLDSGDDSIIVAFAAAHVAQSAKFVAGNEREQRLLTRQLESAAEYLTGGGMDWPSLQRVRERLAQWALGEDLSTEEPR